MTVHSIDLALLCLWTCHLEEKKKKGVHHCVCGLAGIQEKLDHFQYLNVKSVWIGPVYSSPMRDFGYDVEDFRAIHPLFGTMADFEELLADMHDKGVAGNVMVDYHVVVGVVVGVEGLTSWNVLNSC